MTPCATCNKPLTDLHRRMHPQPPPLPKEPEWRRRLVVKDYSGQVRA